MSSHIACPSLATSQDTSLPFLRSKLVPRLPLRGKRSVLPGVERPQGRDSLGPFYVWVVRTSMSLHRSHRGKLNPRSKNGRSVPTRR